MKNYWEFSEIQIFFLKPYKTFAINMTAYFEIFRFEGYST